MNDISAELAPAGTALATRRPATIRGPLTFQQSFLWDYLSLNSGDHVRDAFLFRICGSLNSDLLAKSLSEIVRRHDCLRTRIVMTDGMLEQHVDDPVERDLEVLDLTDLTQADREVRANDFLRGFSERKFELAVGPPTNAALIRMSREETLLAWAIHHVIADGMTIRIVLEEMWCLYGQLLEGRQQPRLTRAPVGYLDYAVWQHATHDDWLQKHELYWKNRLPGAACAHWPSDPDVATDQGANAGLQIGSGMPPLADLRRVARIERTTPAMVMLAVYAAVVASWCRQSAFAIPVNIAGRHRPEHEHAAGYFAQFLYVCVEVADNETFLELLGKVSAEFREALTHQDFGKVARQVPGVLLGSLFSWVPWRSGSVGVPAASASNEIGVTVQPLPLARTRSLNFKGIGTFFCEAEGEYSTDLWYRTDAVSTSSVERFGSQLRNWCMRVVRNPQCRLLESATAQ